MFNIISKLNKLLSISIIMIVYNIDISNAKTANIVQLGDTIILSKNNMSKNGKAVTVEWQQNFSSRSGDYVVVSAVLDGKNSVTKVFVQKSMVTTFTNMCSSISNECKLRIRKDFRYRQNSSKTSRFLVYHDTSRNPYKHRFNTTSIFGQFKYLIDIFFNIGGKYLTSYYSNLDMGLSVFGLGSSAAKAFVGDPLHDFWSFGSLSEPEQRRSRDADDRTHGPGFQHGFRDQSLHAEQGRWNGLALVFPAYGTAGGRSKRDSVPRVRGAAIFKGKPYPTIFHFSS